MPLLVAFSALAQQQNVNLLSQVPLDAFSLDPISCSDVWGFSDGLGNEYAIVGTYNGTTVFWISDPMNPQEVATIPGVGDTLRDIKTLIVDDSAINFEAYAYVVTEGDTGGMQVLDLSDVPTSVSLLQTYRGNGLDTAHNVFISPLTNDPYAFVLGANIDGGGVTVLDLAHPPNPVQVGAWTDKYVHDIFVSNHWADPEYDGTDIAIAFCAFLDITLINISDKTSPQTITSYAYPGLFVTHSGWMSDDGRYLFAFDELDEHQGNNTTVRVIDLIDLDNPVVVHEWIGPTQAVDHNGFVKGNFLHLSNYRRGYTLLDISNPLAVTHHGYYDTYPADDDSPFDGAFGVYPFYDSGTVAVTDKDSGLFLLIPDIAPGFRVIMNDATQLLCEGGNGDLTIQTTSILGFSEPIQFQVLDLPAGMTAQFTPHPVTPGTSTTLNLVAGAGPGSYLLTIQATAAGADTVQRELLLEVVDGPDEAPQALMPEMDADCVGRSGISYSWGAAGPDRSYRVQISADAAFTQVVVDEVVTEAVFMLSQQLSANAAYHWRVNSINPCGASPFSPSRSFFTTLTPVLLVDDDDNNPDVGQTYRDALDDLGIAHKTWDIGGGSDDGPPLLEMENYSWIIWFSGDQYGVEAEEAGPTAVDEARLTDFLAGGGALFLSSQDYVHDRGITPFMGQQLGLQAAGSDTGNYEQVVGLGSFSGYGTLSLEPSLGNEFFDDLTPTPTAELVLQGTNGRGAAIRFQNTLFTGFSFSTLIVNEPVTARQILQDLVADYEITCELGCAVYDLNGNGLDITDLVLRLPGWPLVSSVTGLIPVVDCLNAL